MMLLLDQVEKNEDCTNVRNILNSKLFELGRFRGRGGFAEVYETRPAQGQYVRSSADHLRSNRHTVPTAMQHRTSRGHATVPGACSTALPQCRKICGSAVLHAPSSGGIQDSSGCAPRQNRRTPTRPRSRCSGEIGFNPVHRSRYSSEETFLRKGAFKVMLLLDQVEKNEDCTNVRNILNSKLFELGRFRGRGGFAEVYETHP